MLSKAEIKSCLAGRYTPIVPAYFFWMDETFIAKNQLAVNELHRYYEDDFIFTHPRLVKRFEDVPLAAYEFADEWGSLFRVAPGGVGAHPSRPIVTSIAEWEEYVDHGLPQICSGVFAKEIQKEVARFPGNYVIANLWRTFYERMYMLRGLEDLLVGIALEDELFLRMLPVLRDFTISCIEEIARAGADAVFLADDWGMQDRLQISLASWKRHFKPAYTAMIETAHGAGLDVWFHSCGNITKLVPEWVSLGLDVLGQLQPSAMDLSLLAKDYRGRLTFFGGIDVQFNLVNGNRESIRAEVENLVRFFRPREGRYIFSPSNSIMPETPIENVFHLFEAIQEYKFRVR